MLPAASQLYPADTFVQNYAGASGVFHADNDRVLHLRFGESFRAMLPGSQEL